MFTTPAPSAPTLSTTTTPASPTSGRTGRLRGLSYLRNYTQSHLHGRPDGESSGRTHRPSAPRSHSQPNTAKAEPKPEQASQRHASIASQTQNSGSTSGWQPTPGGRGGVTRVSNRELSTSETPSSTTAPTVGITTTANSTGTRSMTRNRAETAAPVLTVRNPSTPSITPKVDDGGPGTPLNLPSIRFIPHYDPRATRPSLSFPAVSRTLPNENAIIKVGRYSERESAPEIAPNTPSSAPVGFKSKVVSRRHCEFWCQGHQWYIKDVKSSSGTFLNHVRLSPPAAESKPWPVNDGDVVQLGIDFRGGEEPIFRCVKMRVEVNRGWQKALNNFNRSTHKRLRNLSKPAEKRDSDAGSVNSSECSICLMSIAPCQSLFVAPCSHVWHYKCIRPILNGNTWPNFLCPNCRAMADLEADVEDLQDEWDDSEEIEQAIEASRKESTGSVERNTNGDVSKEGGVAESQEQSNITRERIIEEEEVDVISLQQSEDGDDDGALLDATAQLSISDHQGEQSSSSLTTPRPIPLRPGTSRSHSSPDNIQYVLSPGIAPGVEGPMTPRNDAGPFVLDGGAGQRGSRGRGLPTLNVIAAVEDLAGNGGESRSQP